MKTFKLLRTNRPIEVPEEQVFGCLDSVKKKYTLPEGFKRKGNVILDAKGAVVLEKVIKLEDLESAVLPFGFVLKGNSIIDPNGLLVFDLETASKKVKVKDSDAEGDANDSGGNAPTKTKEELKKEIEASLKNLTVEKIEEHLVKHLKAKPAQFAGMSKEQKVQLAVELSFPS